jgi:hypothetical protein
MRIFRGGLNNIKIAALTCFSAEQKIDTLAVYKLINFEPVLWLLQLEGECVAIGQPLLTAKNERVKGSGRPHI